MISQQKFEDFPILVQAVKEIPEKLIQVFSAPWKSNYCRSTIQLPIAWNLIDYLFKIIQSNIRIMCGRYINTVFLLINAAPLGIQIDISASL